MDKYKYIYLVSLCVCIYIYIYIYIFASCYDDNDDDDTNKVPDEHAYLPLLHYSISISSHYQHPNPPEMEIIEM